MEKGKAAFNELIHKHIPELRSELQKVYQKQLDHDVGAMVETFVSTKEQMKKMAEQNATPTVAEPGFQLRVVLTSICVHMVFILC